jgi:hypothetical protein
MNVYRILVTIRERYHMADMGIKGRIPLKWILMKLGERRFIGF